MLKMIADHMENGFLDNIVAMFRQDSSLYPMIAELLEDERSRVRIGTIALVETLIEEEPDKIRAVIPAIARILRHSNPTLRGDAAYLLGIIGHKDALTFLSDLSHDKHELVRQTVQEAIDEINGAENSL